MQLLDANPYTSDRGLRAPAPRLLPPQRACQKPLYALLDALAVEQDSHQGLRDGHIDSETLAQIMRRPRRIDALADRTPPPQDRLEGLASPQRHPQ